MLSQSQHMRVAQRLRRKGEFKMRSLVTEIREVHWACQTVRGRVTSGSEVEFDHIDGVLIALDHALVSIRTLDKEVFQKSHPPAYEQLRSTRGQVVRGLTAPRDAAVHSAEVVDPDIPRAVGPISDLFIVYPRWKERSAIAPDAFPRTASGVLAAYDAEVAGRYLQDTLFDALRFFDTCDRDLVARDAEGQIEGLPLPPLPVPGYHRLHPDWPSHEEVEGAIRANARACPPGGTRRRVEGTVDAGDHGTVLCGYTEVGGGSALAFIEPIAQVVADIRMGYLYEISLGGATRPVEERGGALFVAGTSLEKVGLSEVSDLATWQTWATLAMSDAEYYRRQRIP